MTVDINDNGRMSSYVGDTILFNCGGVPTDMPYLVYFAAMYKDGTPAFDNMTFIPNEDTVDIEIPPYITDLVIVPTGKKYVDLIYSLKACNSDNTVEHTLQVLDNPVGTENILRMYRKQNEGTPPTPTPAGDDDSDSDSDTDTDDN